MPPQKKKQNGHILIPKLLNVLHSKGDFTDVTISRIGDREVILGYPGGPDVITRVLRSQRGRQEREQFEDVTLLALKVEEGPGAKKCRWSLEAGKGEEMDCPLEPLERNSPLLTP